MIYVTLNIAAECTVATQMAFCILNELCVFQANLPIICQIIRRLKYWFLSWVKCTCLLKAHRG